MCISFSAGILTFGHKIVRLSSFRSVIYSYPTLNKIFQITHLSLLIYSSIPVLDLDLGLYTRVMVHFIFKAHLVFCDLCPSLNHKWNPYLDDSFPYGLFEFSEDWNRTKISVYKMQCFFLLTFSCVFISFIKNSIYLLKDRENLTLMTVQLNPKTWLPLIPSSFNLFYSKRYKIGCESDLFLR